MDPRISEWGNLAHLHGELPPAECIGWLGGTRGSETSQYPQEEKIIMILLVVASERG